MKKMKRGEEEKEGNGVHFFVHCLYCPAANSGLSQVSLADLC